MKSHWEKRRFHAKSLLGWLEKWRWLILAIIGLSLLWVEVQEFLVLRVLNQAFHYFEVFQYAVLLVSTGLLIELFARSSRDYKQAIKILEFKHRLSLELTSNTDWEDLTSKIAKIPGAIASVDESYLLINDPLAGKFDPAGFWGVEPQSNETEAWDPSIPCMKCHEKLSVGTSNFHLCRDAGTDTTSPYVYSLKLHSQDFPNTVLRFKMKPGLRLLPEEEQIFSSIGDEIIASLQISQDRKRLSEMQSAQVSMAERRTVSSFVHDHLGQNLGYMHLKLDQLSSGDEVKRLRDIRGELKKLRDIANESYEIVRDILKRIQPETIPHLTNLLHEHASTVSRRAKFELDFKSMGKPVHLTDPTQRLIFFTFREILSNVEKHAEATKVNVLVNWSEQFFDISVVDNGQGFEVDTVDSNEHFGIEIMKERLLVIKGQYSITSSTGAGTVVSISVPIDAWKVASV